MTPRLICVKEDLLRKSPNSLTRTFLNANIPRQVQIPKFAPSEVKHNERKK
jgi:hypothetical protein